MRKRPGMTLLVIAALIMGIGVNSAVFTVVNAVLIRPWPVPDPDRLVLVIGRSQASRPDSTCQDLSNVRLDDWRLA